MSRRRAGRSGRVRRRLLLLLAGVVILTVTLGAAFAVVRPRLSTERHGDQSLLDALGEPDGLAHVAVVRVDLDRPARYAGIGADEHTRFEIGSNTKPLTGMLLADAAERGEVGLDDTLGDHLDLGSAPAAAVTLEELASHRSGLPRDGEHAEIGLCWVTGTNCVSLDLPTLLADLRTAELSGRGTVSYSNLGAAALGQALAASSGRPYADLLAERILAPLGMSETAVQSPQTGPLAPKGHQPWGLRPQNWVMDGYQPAGGLVSTSSDLGSLLSAVLDGSAPGIEANEPLTAYPDAPTVAGITEVHVGLLWMSGQLDGHRVLVHTGETAGYRSAMLVDLDAGRAAAVLSDVNAPVGQLAAKVLAAP